ncbi:hypothetical protein D3C72_619160 [compost metagenome]
MIIGPQSGYHIEFVQVLICIFCKYTRYHFSTFQGSTGKCFLVGIILCTGTAFDCMIGIIDYSLVDIVGVKALLTAIIATGTILIILFMNGCSKLQPHAFIGLCREYFADFGPALQSIHLVFITPWITGYLWGTLGVCSLSANGIQVYDFNAPLDFETTVSEIEPAVTADKVIASRIVQEAIIVHVHLHPVGTAVEQHTGA